MTVREAKATQGKRARKSNKSDEGRHRNPAEIELDMARFIQAFGHLDDALLKERALMEDLRQVMDNELLHALNTLLHHWHWCQPDGVTQDKLDEVFAVEELRLKLEALQKTRLRDIIRMKPGGHPPAWP